MAPSLGLLAGVLPSMASATLGLSADLPTARSKSPARQNVYHVSVTVSSCLAVARHRLSCRICCLCRPYTRHAAPSTVESQQWSHPGFRVALAPLLGHAGLVCTISWSRDRGLIDADFPIHIYGPEGVADYIR